jgi:glycerate 2-kinase
MTLASDARAILRAGVGAADPVRAVRSVVRRRSNGLSVGGHPLVPGRGGQVRVVGLGKAAAAMADAAAALIGPDVTGLVAVPRGYPAPRSAVRVVWGDHPIPSAASLAAGRALLRAVEDADPVDRILFVISGGGSAAAEVPTSPLSIRAVARTTELLLASGAPIQSMNAVRRHLSEVKGGRLGKAAPPRGFATVAISDVVGDSPDDVASGPTVPDPTTFRDALRVVDRWELRTRLPRPVLRHLLGGSRGRSRETPKPNDPAFRGTVFRFGATNRTALRAAAHAAGRLGYTSRLVRSAIVGDSQGAARRFAAELVRGSRRRPFALLAGGETTVRLGPNPGKGGRNQEFVLAAAAVLAGRPGRLVMSAGSDGIDGPTDAAGGWVDSSTLARAEARGVRIPESLRRHASYDALARLGALLRTGPTGTNVMDLHIGLARPQSGYGGK